MRTRGFVRNLKYDAKPRTLGLIELFNRVVALTFDTTHATESQYANCTECVAMALKSLQPAMGLPCRIMLTDS